MRNSQALALTPRGSKDAQAEGALKQVVGGSYFSGLQLRAETIHPRSRWRA